MSHVEKKYIRWDPPSVGDVVKHQVFIAKEGQILDMNSTKAEIPMPTLEAVCPDDFPGNTFNDDTVSYQIGIVAFDDQGNYSDMAILDPYPFDFVPPPAPEGGRVE